jgi:hypothetical protein
VPRMFKQTQRCYLWRKARRGKCMEGRSTRRKPPLSFWNSQLLFFFKTKLLWFSLKNIYQQILCKKRVFYHNFS